MNIRDADLQIESFVGCHNGIGFFGFPGQAALDQLHSLLSKLLSALDFGFSNYQSGQLPRLLSQPST
jgi:hypothetical protein